MTYVVALILPLLFAFPSISVNRSDATNAAFTIRIVEHDPVLAQCQKSGLEVYYRFQMQLCRRRTVWFDECAEERKETHLLEADPASESYRVVSDRHGDDLAPATNTFTSFQEALDEISVARHVPIAFLAGDETDLLEGAGRYLRTRVSFTCRGQSSQALDRLSSILTLGLVSVGSSNSGWIDFFFDS